MPVFFGCCSTGTCGAAGDYGHRRAECAGCCDPACRWSQSASQCYHHGMRCGIACHCSLGQCIQLFDRPVERASTSSGAPDRHWQAAVILGCFAILFGIFSPLVTSLLSSTPTAFLSTLAGLALLRTLLGAFQTSFGPGFPLGGLIAFLVTFTGLPIFNIGAPFWGLVFDGCKLAD